MRLFPVITFIATTMLCACNNEQKFDASGSFEADEVIVSAQQNGQLLSMNVREGDTLTKGDTVGKIDVSNIALQKVQVQATINALSQKTTDPKPQIELVKRQLAVEESQLQQQLKEKTRTENLIKADAATQKQLDDINALIDQLNKQIDVSKQQINLYNSTIATQNRTIYSEQNPLEKSADEIEDQIKKGLIINPLSGTVLTKYAFTGEFASIGKALYKIANVDTITVKAYVTGDQLSQIKSGQQVTVFVDDGAKKYKEYPGTIYWISDKSEFTPKTIQTKDERADLVYAIKIRVKNNGYLKIGMYAEIAISH